MVGTEQICRGAMKYVTRELVPLVSTGKGILLEAFAPAVIEANVKKYMSTSWLEGTGMIDGNTVDLEAVYKRIKTSASGKWPVEIIGFKFTENDLDKLYNYIREV